MVSVIVPNYNHASFLNQRLDSILQQTCNKFELVILDDYSSDNSKEIIEQYRQYSQVSNIIYNATNSRSPFKQWQKGIELAKGDFIWIAESDDYASAEFLSELLSYFDDPHVGLVFCDSYIVNEDAKIMGDSNNWGSKKEGEVTRYSPPAFCDEHLFLLNRIPNASAVLFRKKELLLHPEWIDTNLMTSGDWKLWLHFALNVDIVRVHKKLNYFRKHGNNLTKQNELQKSEGIKILKDISKEEKARRKYRLYESIALWCLSDKAWQLKPVYSIKNFREYFKRNISFRSSIYLLYFILKRSTHYFLTVKTRKTGTI